MTYSKTYNGSDLGTIAVDGVATIIAAIASLATLVGLVLIWHFLKGKIR
jgi:hypothetical protein